MKTVLTVMFYLASLISAGLFLATGEQHHMTQALLLLILADLGRMEEQS